MNPEKLTNQDNFIGIVTNRNKAPNYNAGKAISHIMFRFQARENLVVKTSDWSRTQ